MKQTTLFSGIEEVIASLHTNTISEERKQTLQPLIDFIQEKSSTNNTIRLNFICTHNSRRSHLSQVWAQVMANYFEIKNVFSYSGGTEATALFPMVAETLKKSGFQIFTLSKGENPVYSIKYAANEAPVIGFSKKYEAPQNKKSFLGTGWSFPPTFNKYTKSVTGLHQSIDLKNT